jgi:hypothetical protein
MPTRSAILSNTMLGRNGKRSTSSGDVDPVRTRTVRRPFERPCQRAYMAARTAMLTTVKTLVAVWDRHSAMGLGGVGGVVTAAGGLGLPISIVWPPGRRPAATARTCPAREVADFTDEVTAPEPHSRPQWRWLAMAPPGPMAHALGRCGRWAQPERFDEFNWLCRGLLGRCL